MATDWGENTFLWMLAVLCFLEAPMFFRLAMNTPIIDSSSNAELSRPMANNAVQWLAKNTQCICGLVSRQP